MFLARPHIAQSMATLFCGNFQIDQAFEKRLEALYSPEQKAAVLQPLKTFAEKAHPDFGVVLEDAISQRSRPQYMSWYQAWLKFGKREHHTIESYVPLNLPLDVEDNPSYQRGQIRLFLNEVLKQAKSVVQHRVQRF